MSHLTESERADIRRQIRSLLAEINLQVSIGNATEANELRDQIGGLEKRLQKGDEHGSETD